MANVVTIRRPDVVALIEDAATKFTHGNKTEAVSMALRKFLEQNARDGCLFGAHPGSVRFRDETGLSIQILDVEPDAESGREIER